MSEKTNGKFNSRAFISVLAGFTFFAMAATGLVMFIAPSCRIARDISWTVWGGSKEQWTAVHVWFSIAFVIAAALHIYLNWTALTGYFKRRLHQGLALRTEWVAALAICAVIGLGTLYDVAPFSSLVSWKETFKYNEAGGGAGGQGWRDGAGMGQKTLRQFCQDEGIELSWAISRLQSDGFKVSETMTMREIADGAGMHPSALRSRLQTR